MDLVIPGAKHELLLNEMATGNLFKGLLAEQKL
jgi:hypothetical protein